MIEKLLYVVLSLPFIHILSTLITRQIIRKEKEIERRLGTQLAKELLESGGEAPNEELIIELIINRKTTIDKTKLLMSFRRYLLIAYVWLSWVLLLYISFYNYFN